MTKNFTKSQLKEKKEFFNKNGFVVFENVLSKNDLNKVRKSIIEDSNFYNAGFSINAEKRKLKGNVEWGHVMTATDLYYEKFDGNSLQDLIWNWINDSGPTKYINNN